MTDLSLGYHDGCLYYECATCGGTYAREDGRQLDCILGAHGDRCCHFGESLLFAGRWTVVTSHGIPRAAVVANEVGRPHLRVVK